MAASHGSNARAYFSGYDLSPYLKEISVDEETEKHDSTVLANNGDKTWAIGLRDASAEASGLYDDTLAVGIDAIMAGARRQPSQQLVYLPSGDAVGSYGEVLSGFDTKYSRKSVITDLNKVDLSLQGSGRGMDIIQSLHQLTSEGSSSNGSAVDNSAGTSAGGVGVIQTTALTAGSFTCKIQHSTDNSTWVDLITFTALAANTCERIEVAGTVNRYVRSIWTVSGGSPTMFVGFARN